MKNYLLAGAAALAAAGLAPALAQDAPSAAPMKTAHMPMQPITRAELVQKVQKHFAMLDTNRDGFLTKDEIQASRGSMAGGMDHGMHSDMPRDPGAMFDRLDANHDGVISRDEFNAAHEAMAERMGGKDHMGGGMRAMHAGMMGHMFAMADVNRDGRVSLEEATNAAAAMFDRADMNHDGILTPDEMRAAHQAMRTGHGG